MAFKDRLNGQAFTCANRRFQTNISKGHPHGVGNAGGSVFAQALVNSGYSLWLEYVSGKDGEEMFWLMWYDPDGSPTIPLSGVFEAPDIQEISRGLASFIQVP